MSESSQEVLADAIARNTGLVLSLPSAGLLRHHKSRFLAPAEDGFWVESVPGETPLIQELIGTGRAAGLSFRSGPNRVMFASPLKREEQNYCVSGATNVRALLIAHPDPALIKMIQRRSNYRVVLTPDMGMTARVWRMAARAHLDDKPLRTAELIVEARDFSVGGLGVVVRPNEHGEVKVSTEDRLRIEITYGQVVMVMEGRIRAPNGTPDPTAGLRTGIQFNALQDDLDGRKQLSRLNSILGELQREEIRRFRMGL
jgi:hypothetical protein